MAHRGASADLPEHTLAAFRRAIEVGADGIECDVHLTADRELVCLHDDTVDRTSTGTGPVAEFSLAELRGLDWGSWRAFDADLVAGDVADAHRLVTLEELIDLMLDADRPMDLAIETKHPSPFGHELERAVLDLLASVATRRSVAHLRLRIITFSASAISYLRDHAPDMVAEYLIESWNAELLSGALPPGATAFGPRITMLTERPEFVRQLVADGVEVHPWTVDDPEDARAAVEVGCTIITTNRPVEIAAALA